MKHRKIVLSSILVLLIAIVLFQICWQRSHISIDKNNLDPKYYTNIGKDGSPLHRGRINQLLATLRTESLQESVVNLTNDSQQYHYPGVYSGDLCPQNMLEVLLSARRVTKVLQTVEKLGKAESLLRNKVLFQECFDRYKNITEKILESYENPDAPTNSVSVQAAQYAVNTCMLATALSGSTEELCRQMEQIEQFLEATEARIKKNESRFPKNYRLTFRSFLEPDNRFILNALVYSVFNSDETRNKQGTATAFLKDYPRKEVPIVVWDAKTGYYDYVHVHEGIPISKNSIDKTLVVYDWPQSLCYNDAKQKEVIKQFRGQVSHINKADHSSSK